MLRNILKNIGSKTNRHKEVNLQLVVIEFLIDLFSIFFLNFFLFISGFKGTERWYSFYAVEYHCFLYFYKNTFFFYMIIQRKRNLYFVWILFAFPNSFPDIEGTIYNWRFYCSIKNRLLSFFYMIIWSQKKIFTSYKCIAVPSWKRNRIFNTRILKWKSFYKSNIWKHLIF